MKKNFFYLALSLVVLSGCTSEGQDSPRVTETHAIGFEHVLSKGTRADGALGDGVDITNDNFNKFLVYGYYIPKDSQNPIQVFNEEEVTRLKTSDTWLPWSYVNERYWVPDAQYYFYAYSCSDVALSSSLGTVHMDLENTTKDTRALRITDFLCDSRHQHDLIYATAEAQPGANGQNGPVSFKFKHLLSKVQAKFISKFAADYEMVVTNVRFEGVYNQGDYDPTPTIGWNAQERVEYTNDRFPTVKEPMVFMQKKGDRVTATTTKEGVTDFAYVLPNNYGAKDTSVRLKFTVELLKDGRSIIKDMNLTGTWKPMWIAGRQYLYTIEVGGAQAGLQGIAFETDMVGNFETGESSTITIETGPVPAGN